MLFCLFIPSYSSLTSVMARAVSVNFEYYMNHHAAIITLQPSMGKALLLVLFRHHLLWRRFLFVVFIRNEITLYEHEIVRLLNCFEFPSDFVPWQWQWSGPKAIVIILSLGVSGSRFTAIAHAGGICGEDALKTSPQQRGRKKGKTIFNQTLSWKQTNSSISN